MWSLRLGPSLRQHRVFRRKKNEAPVGGVLEQFFKDAELVVLQQFFHLTVQLSKRLLGADLTQIPAPLLNTSQRPRHCRCLQRADIQRPGLSRTEL